MRKQYHFKPSSNGFFAWDVDKLIEQSKDIPITMIPISKIRELDEPYWYGEKNSVPTCRSIVEHMQMINEVDLSYPIILAADNSVMDGMHRVGKALLHGVEKIRAVAFEKTPPPDFEDVHPDDLEY